jgi:ribonuclease BN (tRNA processing enzyme)
MLLAAPTISAARERVRSQDLTQAAASCKHGAKIVLLGTKGGPDISAARSESASLLVVDGEPYLIDAGTGTTRQIARAGYQVTSISMILITHNHLDHTGGLASVISNIAANRQWTRPGERDAPLVIYGPPATKVLVDASLQFAIVHDRIFRASMPSLAPFDPKLFVVQEITHGGRVFKDARVTVTAVENTHFRRPSYGPDGIRDMSFSYRFDTPSGSVVFTGDSGTSDAVTQLATGADVLVSEIYQPYIGKSTETSTAASPRDKERTEELRRHMNTEHLTPAEVGKMAAQAGVKTVILNHMVVAAFNEKSFAAIRAGVGRWYHGRLIIGDDLRTFAMKEPTCAR